MTEYALFPRQGDRIRSHSVFFQASRAAHAGYCGVSGMEAARASASSISVSSGYYKNEGLELPYAGGSITAIPAASAGMHRYDLIVMDCTDDTLKRIAGTEAIPTSLTDFLENLSPKPPELPNLKCYLIAIICVDEDGIQSGDHGSYCTAGVADMRIVSPVFATLDSNSLVVQNPANATATPAASKIVVAGEDGKIAEGWLPAIAGGSTFWTSVPGSPTRVADTQFTLTDTGNANLYDQILKRGVILIWLEGSTFQTAMVVSSSYSSNAVTVNIVGDSLTAGFTSMKYCANHAMVEQFIRPGKLGAGTDAFKTWFAPCDVYILAADARVKSAGTTNATVFDINDDGSTKFTTKPSIASGSTSDLDNVATNPSTLVAEGSAITADIDSVSTTPPSDAYIYIYYYPVSWRYRS